jgi:MFS family permease
MAEGWLALELTNNAFLVGLVASAASLPVLLLSFLAGVVIDRADRLRVVQAMQALMLCQATSLWLLTLTGHLTIGWLLALAVANGVFSAFEIPARQSLVVELVGREDLGSAIALNSSGFNLARVVGPATGAVVIATLGIAWCFAVNAASYLAVLVGLFMVRLPARALPAAAGSPLAGLREGFAFMWHTRDVRHLMAVVLVFSVFGVPYLTLMPVVARDLLGLGAGGYGVLLAAVGVGGFAGALFVASVGSRLPRVRLLVAASFAYAVLLVVFSLVRSPLVARLVLLAVGFAMICNGALSNGILQHRVPDALRGRLMAAYSFVVVGMAQVVGSFLGGAVARAAGADWAIGGGAAVMLGYGAWTYVRHPDVWRRAPASAAAAPVSPPASAPPRERRRVEHGAHLGAERVGSEGLRE